VLQQPQFRTLYEPFRGGPYWNTCDVFKAAWLVWQRLPRPVTKGNEDPTQKQRERRLLAMIDRTDSICLSRHRENCVIGCSVGFPLGFT